MRAALIDALQQRLAIIGDHQLRSNDPAAQLVQLEQISQKLGQLSMQLPPSSDTRLRHYLEQCSYGKALEHLLQSR